MSHQPGYSLGTLFEAALQDYEKQMGVALTTHPLAKQLQNCGSVDSVAAVLREQAQDFSEFQRKDKAMKPLKNIVSVLYELSAVADFDQVIGLVRPDSAGADWVFSDPDRHPIAFPAYDSNTHRPGYPTLSLCLSLAPKRASS
jgi:hypothetical protein